MKNKTNEYNHLIYAVDQYLPKLHEKIYNKTLKKYPMTGWCEDLPYIYYDKLAKRCKYAILKDCLLFINVMFYFALITKKFNR